MDSLPTWAARPITAAAVPLSAVLAFLIPIAREILIGSLMLASRLLLLSQVASVPLPLET
jgi:hypothetical protein